MPQPKMRQDKSMLPRVVADCRTNPMANCTVSISGTEEEVIKLALRHAIVDHGFKESEQLKNQVKSMLKEER